MEGVVDESQVKVTHIVTLKISLQTHFNVNSEYVDSLWLPVILYSRVISIGWYDIRIPTQVQVTTSIAKLADHL